MDTIEQVLVALRRIIRATDIHSSHLAKTTGMTAPQILLLRAIQEKPDASVGGLSEQISLSHATVTTMINRLEKRGLVERNRSTQDKRVVHVKLTPTGASLVKKAPVPLQNRFADQFYKLDDWEQSMMLSSLQRIASMMDAQGLDASPVLDIGQLDRQSPDSMSSK